jgi:putative transposase
MPRRPRIAPGGYVYHVLNRAVARLPLFRKPADYDAFEQVIERAHQRHPIRLFAYCIMPNHWHLVLGPQEDGDLTAFVRWLTHTHTMRWHAHHETSGTGHLYQGRFKSFPVQTDAHFLTVCRYVERNALRAGLVSRAEDWQYNSLWRRRRGNADLQALLARWPIDPPRNWVGIVNQPLAGDKLEAVRRSAQRGTPYGSETWTARIARQLRLNHSLRPRGRPPKRAARR